MKDKIEEFNKISRRSYTKNKKKRTYAKHFVFKKKLKHYVQGKKGEFTNYKVLGLVWSTCIMGHDVIDLGHHFNNFISYDLSIF